jgi:putative tryptophan/tyrosine transport system substrate-binding protein
MNKRIFCVALCAMLYALCVSAEAQQSKKVPRIGFLSPGSPSSVTGRYEAFRYGLRELGYVEGKNIVIEQRYAEGKVDRLSALAVELVRLKVDIIFTVTTPGVLAAKKATKNVPIVFAGTGDPVRGGLVTSLAWPGGNITGLSILSPELDGKRLELLKETVPKIARVAYLWNPVAPGTGLKGMEVAAPGARSPTSIPGSAARQRFRQGI